MSNRVPPRSRAHQACHPQDINPPHHQEASALPKNRYVHHYHHGTAVVSHHHPSVSLYRNSYGNTGGATTVDTGLSDDTYTDTATYYEYYNDTPLYQNHNVERTCYSEDSGSTRLPLYESDDTNSVSRNNMGYAERGTQNRRSQLYREQSSASSNAGRDLRRVYPNPQDVAWERMYQEIPPHNGLPQAQNSQIRVPVSRFSNRPQSSLSSAIGSTVVDGCGGKCQTCENVCYFFLQLVFTMGILIGISLCIAGIVLRKSAAKNLQVLVYIGVLVSLVSALLLGIQCNARKNAKNRKKALWTAKRAPIPMDTLNIHGGVVLPQQQPLMVIQENRTQQRVVQVPQIAIDIQRQRNLTISPDSSIDEQGIPWWRRKDLKT
ncbi:hypothetical protein WA026_001373 [Henosepilachna vigintioctopunctata]|uniref:Uncharacterized protein n=1 Tax=Henosepilachna vigintioctopunctata TaxID=420089 RepID=A0AAW1URT2_9CUCU